MPKKQKQSLRSRAARISVLHSGYMGRHSAPSYASKLLHKRRLHWFMVLAVGVVLIQLAYNMQVGGGARALSLATTIEHSKLLDATNATRRGEGQRELHLDARLSEAAQAKAQDMIDKNYWSHDTPDGTASWEFIARAQYPYKTAGENLAYGFKNSEAVIQAWMKSSSHRANILGRYQDVGFGYASGEHYQNGKNTVIVAFFGTPTEVTHATQAEVTQAISGSPAPHHVLGASVVAAGAAPWGTYASLGLTAAVAMGFMLTHLELMRLNWQRAKRYMILHPLADAIALAVLVVVLIQALGGFIG